MSGNRDHKVVARYPRRYRPGVAKSVLRSMPILVGCRLIGAPPHPRFPPPGRGTGTKGFRGATLQPTEAELAWPRPPPAV